MNAFAKIGLCALGVALSGYAASTTGTTLDPRSADLLSLMPHRAVAALLLPPAPVLLDKALAVTGRILPPDLDAQQTVDEWLRQNVPETDCIDLAALPACLADNGFAPDAPAAVFWDLTSVAEDAAATVEMYRDGKAGLTSIPKRPPAWTAVFTCTDGGKAEAFALDLARRWNPAISRDSVLRATADTHVRWYGDALGCCHIADRMIIGNDVALLMDTLARVTRPHEIAFALPLASFVASDVILVMRTRTTMHMPNLAPLIGHVIPLFAKDADRQAAVFDRLKSVYPEDGVVLTALSLTDDKVEASSWFDVSACPTLAIDMADLAPWRLTRVLSPDNDLRFAVRGTAPLRTVVGGLFDLVPQNAWLPIFQQVRELVDTMLASEVVAGFSISAQPPGFCLAAIVPAQGELRSLLAGLAVPVPDSDLHELWRFACEWPDIYLTVSGDAAIVATSRELCVAAKSRVSDEAGDPGFLVDRTPPIDISNSLVVCSLDTETLAQGIPLLVPDLAPDTARLLGRLAETIREVRVVKNKSGSVQNQTLSVYFRQP